MVPPLYITRNTEWFHENPSIYTKSRFVPQWAFWALDFVCPLIFTVELLGKALKPQSGGEVSFLLSIGK